MRNSFLNTNFLLGCSEAGLRTMLPGNVLLYTRYIYIYIIYISFPSRKIYTTIYITIFQTVVFSMFTPCFSTFIHSTLHRPVVLESPDRPDRAIKPFYYSIIGYIIIQRFVHYVVNEGLINFIGICTILGTDTHYVISTMWSLQ